MRSQLVTVAFFAATLLVGSRLPILQAQEPGEITTEKQKLETQSGEVIDYEVGTLFVPENRSDADSRVIGVGFLRLPALQQPPPAPPMFLLPGGPGSSYLSLLKSSNQSRLERLFEGLAPTRAFSDIVLVDQRGFSERGDVLRATFRAPARRPDEPRTLEDLTSAFQDFARETVAEFAKGEIDLRGYSVKECAGDVADLRQALGYDKIILNGTSFGSQWSFAVMAAASGHRRPRAALRRRASQPRLRHAVLRLCRSPTDVADAGRRPPVRALLAGRRHGRGSRGRHPTARTEAAEARGHRQGERGKENPRHDRAGRISMGQPDQNSRAVSWTHQACHPDGNDRKLEQTESKSRAHRAVDRLQPRGDAPTPPPLVDRPGNALLGSHQLRPLLGDGRHLAEPPTWETNSVHRSYATFQSSSPRATGTHKHRLRTRSRSRRSSSTAE